MKPLVDREAHRDCELFSWDPWSACSKSCGGGIKSRTRGSQEIGKHCLGSKKETQECNAARCPVDCAWDIWGQWSRCSAPCGGGKKQRTRTVASQARYNGRQCSEADGTQQEDCGTAACGSDCIWDVWFDWSSCSVSCGGGVKRRQRSIHRSELPGGKACSGLKVAEAACNTQSCLGAQSKDCTWSTWDNWGSCSVSCGSGTATRSRSVSIQQEGGGKPCQGSSYEARVCAGGNCAVDCAWTDWSPWSACSATCRGIESSTRSRGIRASNGGRPCEGSTQRTRPCKHTTPCPGDCQWNQWNSWSACTKSCGGGTRERARTVKVPKRANGTSCEGSSRETGNCSKASCPVDCQWDEWASWSVCSAPCGNGTVVRKRLRKVPPSNGGGCPGSDSEERSCTGDRCAKTVAAVSSGAVKQVTGELMLEVNNSKEFAMNAGNKQAIAKFLTVVSGVPLSGIHVSLVPDLGKTTQVAATNLLQARAPSVNQRVHAWYSLLVKTADAATLLSEILQAKNLTHMTDFVNTYLTEAGRSSEVPVAVSKLTASNGQKAAATNPTAAGSAAGPASSTSAKSGGGAASSQKGGSSNGSSTGSPSGTLGGSQSSSAPSFTQRVTGVIRISTPQAAVISADDKGETAVAKVLSKLCGLPTGGAHVSLMPGESGQLDGWFSLQTLPAASSEAAALSASNVAAALVKLDLPSASKILQEEFRDAGLWKMDPSDSASAPKVIALDASAKKTVFPKGSKADKLDPGSSANVKGVMRIAVKEPAVFVADVRATEAVRQALSELAGVPMSNILISTTPTQAGSILIADQREHEFLAELSSLKGIVNVSFTLQFPETKANQSRIVASKLTKKDHMLASLVLQGYLTSHNVQMLVHILQLKATGPPVTTTTTTTTTTAPVV
eukprot:TRINITY_DN1449_c0_g1_i2.p1 TRINITY_DN1449_c0_g1~~TRINITY_DN1449_c0_g1_i2.p1  ORF type:complete len:899 (+),score=143.23 TRINITY_DN1449_c0_g1_i2:601-3297(+)